MELRGALRHVERVVAIVGCQRSGTTVTGQIVGAHPSAVLIDEEEGLYAWFADLLEGGADDGSTRALLRRSADKYTEPSTRFEINGEVSLHPHVRAIVLKAPNLTYDAEALSRLGVPVTVLYPVRDPRAVAASMARLPHIDFVTRQQRLIERHPEVAAQHDDDLRLLRSGSGSIWARRGTIWRIKSGREHEFRRRGMRVESFRYEDLMTDPDTLLERLLAACGLSLELGPRNPHGVYRGAGPGGTDRTRELDRASLSRWRQQLSTSQAREVMAAAAPLAETLGYA